MTMEKQKSHAFGKDVYLLGENEYGEYLWLESPSWDCGWYWGFGYVETYTRHKSPSSSRDISSHSHFGGLVGFKNEHGNYVHHLNESPKMKETVLSNSESWQLSDLMKSFYALRKVAEIFHTGNSHLTSTPMCDLKNKEIEEHINKVAMKQIFNSVIQILSPEKKKTED